MFDRYQEAVEGDSEQDRNSLYDDINQQEENVYWDCEFKGVVSVVELRTGMPENPQHQGRPFFVAELRVEDTFEQSLHPEDSKAQSQIGEGTIVTHHNWLPRAQDPDMIPLSEKYSLAEALELCAAILGVQEEYMDVATADELCEDDGARVQGHTLGASVTGSPGDGEVFYNPSYYPVNEDGKRVPPKSPEELKG